MSVDNPLPPQADIIGDDVPTNEYIAWLQKMTGPESTADPQLQVAGIAILQGIIGSATKRTESETDDSSLLSVNLTDIKAAIEPFKGNNKELTKHVVSGGLGILAAKNTVELKATVKQLHKILYKRYFKDPNDNTALSD